MSALALRRFALAAILIGVAWIAAGCSLRGELHANVPPETSLFVSGDVDTVSHTVHLYWVGADRDGEVAGFQWRFINGEQPADTSWKFTTRTDSVFVVFDTLGYVTPRFEIRTVDNENAVDPTPAAQLFRFTNQPPTVRFLVRPAANESTFASVTVTWSAADLDGDVERLRFRLWLDGQENAPRFVSGRTFTLPSADFGTTGAYASGFRSLYIQAIDDGGRSGNIDSTRWFVRAPVTGTRARLLIVDDVPSTNALNFRIDSLYANAAARNLGADQYSILRLQFTQPFRSPADVAQTFGLFDAVVWYRGTEVGFSTLLNTNESGIRDYLAHGGKFYIDGLYLLSGLNATGPFSQAFGREVLGMDHLVNCFSTARAVNDSSAGWGNGNGSVFYVWDNGVVVDSLRENLLGARTDEASGIRWFAGIPTANVLLAATPGALSPVNAEPAPVGLSVPQPGGGRCVFLTLPLGPASSFPGTPSFNPAARFLSRVFAQLGLTGP